jgi:pyridoxamine 5'-phosphate oxidase
MSIAHRLRSIPSLTGTAPDLDLGVLPTDPHELFTDWLDTAITAAVPEPIAVTLSTVDADDVPDSRTLLLKDVDERGWAFAGTSSSRKAAQLSAHSAAALSLWWQPQMRAVRVRGPVVEASPQECQADLAARSPQARAAVPPGEWRVWRVQPERIEFWQGSVDRQHIRIVYTRAGEAWALTTDRGENAR